MRCSKCDKTIDRNDRFCRFCGQPVTVKPSPPIGLTKTRGVKFPIELNNFGPAEILAPFESQNGAAWGAHLYIGSSKAAQEVTGRPEGCPEWVESKHWFRWFRRGLVVWDHTTQSIGAILSGEALALLEKLQTSAEWKTHGIPIVERHKNWLKLDESEKPKRLRKKKGAKPEPELPPEEAKPQPKFFEEERLRLTGRAAEEFVAYLQANETQLRQMAEQEEQLEQEAGRRFFQLLVPWHRRHELEEFDATGRKLPWIRQAYPSALVCDVPPDRGTIKLSEDGWWWLPCIEQPGHLKVDDERFLQLQEALDWVEQQLPALRARREAQSRAWEREEAEEREKIAALPKKDLTPYWIAPSALEPSRITYRVLIELEYERYSSKKIDISFGEFWHLEDEFYSPTMLARELKLALNQVEVEQLVSCLGFYHIRSATTYYESPLAAAQAQHLWDQSAIGEHYQQRKVLQARYGFQEVETKYCAWLGGLEKPAAPWPLPETWADYLASCAMQETLLYALDVNGYRQFKEVSYKHMNDEQLLVRMHQARAQSRHLPAEACAESQQWLKEYAP